MTLSSEEVIRFILDLINNLGEFSNIHNSIVISDHLVTIFIMIH